MILKFCLIFLVFLIDVNHQIIGSNLVEALQNPFDVNPQCQDDVNPDLCFDDEQMIKYRGFEYESHEAVTSDCYILELHRIVNPQNNNTNKPPVLIVHGILGTSTDWIFNTIGGSLSDNDNRNLGFYLAKMGYDVWLGNVRGNYYSRKHTTYSTAEPQFWKFTFDNHAFQDLPAMIAYIQDFTNYDQIGYIGYSLSTQTMFMLLSFKPEVANSIQPYIAMGPVAFQGNVKSPFIFPSYAPTLLKASLFTNTEVLPKSTLNNLTSQFCTPEPFPETLCENFLYTIFGYSEDQLNKTRLPVYTLNLPAGTSLANIAHVNINAHYQKFMLLDYLTKLQNLICYGTFDPPIVPIQNIIHRSMYLINGEQDKLADPADIQIFIKNLTVPVVLKTISNWEHLDFMVSEHVDTAVYNYIIDVLKQKTPSMKVNPGQQLRLKLFTEDTCTPANRFSLCHMNFKKALNDID